MKAFEPKAPATLVWDYFEDCLDRRHVFCAFCQKTSLLPRLQAQTLHNAKSFFLAKVQ